MKRILFPTDFSDNADKALDMAISFAGRTGGTLIVFNAYDLPYSQNVMSTSILEIMRETSEKSLAKVKEKITAAGVKCVVSAKLGNPIRIVKEMVKREKADIVIMGTQGATGLEELLIGSNTASVLHSVDCPVLAIPQDARFEKVDKIVFATDFKKGKNETALGELADIARIFEAEIMVLHVLKGVSGLNEEQNEQKEKLKSVLGDVNYSVHILESDDIEDTIMDFIEENNADMIALMSRRYGFFENLFHVSLTSRIANHTPVPYLALQERK